MVSWVEIRLQARTVGLGAKLMRETLSLAGTDYVEMSAVMAKHNPFAERAGIRKVALQVSAKGVLELAGVLESVGLDRRLFGSVGHVEGRLKAMSKENPDLVRAGFARRKDGPFQRVFFGVAFGRAADYKKRVGKASVAQLARLIKACGFLLQEKAYLFWQKS